MTTTDFDLLEEGDRVEFTNPITRAVSVGTVRRQSRRSESVIIEWDGGTHMEILRHQLRIYRTYYETFRVLPRG